jgi:hypothetical protein
VIGALLSARNASQHARSGIRFRDHGTARSGPGAHSALDIDGIPTCLHEVGGDAGGAATGAADDAHRTIGKRRGKLVKPLRYLPHRDVYSPRRVAGGPFVVFPDIKQHCARGNVCDPASRHRRTHSPNRATAGTR